jgi:hypothetical protein
MAEQNLVDLPLVGGYSVAAKVVVCAQFKEGLHVYSPKRLRCGGGA